MHSNVVVSINDVWIRPTPDRILPTNGSPYGSRSIPDSFIDDCEIDGIESIEQGRVATVNKKRGMVVFKFCQLGLAINTLSPIMGMGKRINCSLKVGSIMVPPAAGRGGAGGTGYVP